MKLSSLSLIALLLLPATSPAQLTIREIKYNATLSDNEARFAVDVDLEATGKTESSATLFDGEVAVLPSRLPDNLRLVRDGNNYRIIAARAGRYQFKLDLVAKITRREPWNNVSFTGPEAAIGAVTAEASGAGVEVQLLTGTLKESTTKDSVTRIRGFLGPDRQVSLRWQSRAAEIARKALLTCETTVAVQVTPTVVKYNTQLRYEILQGSAPRLVLTLPATQALTKLQGEGVRDWQIKPDGGQQTLTIEFIKPVEKAYSLTLLSEQTLDNATATTQVVPPQPTEVERESGSVTLTAEDVLVETDTASGLRQVNAPAGALAAYQFYARPFALTLKLRRIEPVVNATDRVTVRLEESRLLVTHALTLTVEKAGIYTVQLIPQTGFVVADVHGDGIDDWKAADGKLTVQFNSRLLGSRQLEVQLEQGLKTLPEKIEVQALHVTGAIRETSQIGANAAAGIQLKTAASALTGVREISINRLANHGDATLAYDAVQSDWRLALTVERLAPRITAEIFNLVTIGDGLLGGSATIRYAIINQGVQEFRVKVPSRWKNIEFTGPNIRRKELQDDVWIIGLQEKAWGGYTLVVTYDYQFDPHNAALSLGGIHCENVERETGSVAITSAATLQIQETKATGATPTTPADATTIYRIDEAELTANDRSLITRPVLMAYQYAGRDYDLGLQVTRFEELPVLDAVADRTQLTTVITDAGQMLTQASFMVKNNDRQFQTFTLPEGAVFWACYVNNEAVKPEKSGDKLLVPLPRRANRDQAFAVEIVYKQKIDALNSFRPRPLTLAAPLTDMQTTYAEWELCIPESDRLSSFAGNMTIARGTTYSLRDAWQEFLRFYDMVYHEMFGLIIAGIIGVGLLWLIVVAVRRGWRGLVSTVVVLGIFAILAGMLLPALSSSREKARRSQEMNNLKQIGLGLAQFADNNKDQLPAALDEILGSVGTDKVFIDPSSGERIVYVGHGKKWQANPDDVIAYSPTDRNGQGGNVLFGDGHVSWFSRGKFREITSRNGSDVSGSSGMNANLESHSWQDGDRSAAQPTPSSPVVVNGAYALGNITKSGAGNVTLSVDNTFSGGTTINAGGVTVAGKPQTTAMVAGIRPIRIDIPKTGQRFVFTKVLNVGGEPLNVRALVMDREAFNTMRGTAQAAAFVIGLVLAWWQWRRAQPKSLFVALGLALALGAVVSLLLTYRMLHIAMIVALPVLAFTAFIWFVRRWWNRRPKNVEPTPVMPPPIPPAVAGIVLLLITAGIVRADNFQPAKAEVAIQAVAQVVNAPTNNVSILSAIYTGTVQALDAREAARAGQFEAVITLKTTQNNETVPLFDEAVAVQDFSADRQGWFASSNARLVREGNNVSVFVPRAGTATIKLKFLVKIAGDVARRQVLFAIPPALSSRVTVTLDEPEAQVEAPTAVSFQTTTAGQQTQVEAVIGAGERVELNWTPRMKRAADLTTTVFCNNAALVTFGGGVINVRAALEYQVTQGELRQLRVAVPAGQRLMRVEGEGIRTWKLEGQQLSVELVKGVTPSYRLTVETMQDEVGGMKDESVEVPHALEVKRETGLVALKAADELNVSVVEQQELQKVDIDEFVKAGGEKGATSAFRFLKPDFKLTVHVEPVQAQVEAVVRNQARVTTEQISLVAVTEYTIKRAGIFTLRQSLPAGYRVERVTGANLAQWVEKDGTLDVTLKARTIDNYTLTVALVKLLKELPPTVEIAGVQPLDVEKLTGFVSVSAEEGVQVKTVAFDGLTEVPAALIAGTPSGGSGLGFKLIAGEQPAWKLSLATEKIESWVRAEVMDTVTLSETLVSGKSVVRFDIANAPTKEFRIRLPAAYRNVEVTGANIRRKDHDDASGEWRVELQNKVRGIYELTVTWDMPWDVKVGVLEVAGVEAVGVERETGTVAIVAPARFHVETKSTTADLLKVDANDLPEWVQRPAELPVLVYRYLRPGFKLGLAIQRFDEAEVLQALVDSARLTTVVSEDGQMMTEVTLAVRNNARQYLEVTLPPGTTNVWSVFVGGQPVRPTIRGGKLLLPMERSAGDATVTVELTYVGVRPFPRGRGTVELAAPALDVPLKNARWELYLPPDYAYGDFAGTMKREVSLPARGEFLAQLTDESAAHSYSLGDYQAEEGRKQMKEESEVQSLVSNAKLQIASGNLEGANRYWNSVKGRAGDNEELKKVAKDIQQGQARNYVQAQQTFVLENTSGQQLGQQINATSQYDEKAAEQQVAKVAAAQEITVSKALPLRVNLPKRGVYLAFTQVLQTEIGQAMDVKFRAVNERATGWPLRIAAGAAGLLVLWLLVAAVTARRGSR